MKPKILLIDDEEPILRVLSMSLRSDGYEVITAQGGKEGLEHFKQTSPPLVLTDIRMPGMDGLEVLKQVKELKPETEVIIITGDGDLEAAIKALQNGASDFINKPVRDQALTVALERAQEKIAIRRKLDEYTYDLEDMVKIATGEFERKSSFQAKLIRSSNDGIIATDDEWKIVIYNPGAEKIFGHPRSAVIRKVDARDLYPPEVRHLFELSAADDIPKKESAWLETFITSKNQERIPVRFSGTVLREKKTMMGSVAFFQDLREIKRLERDLLKAERLAAIGQTVSGMAHCIKNILHGFKGGSYLVNVGIDKNNTDKLKNGWQMLQRNITRTSDLVLDLLSYSKEREPEYEVCAPNTIADDVCELLKESASDYHIEIVKNYSTSIGDVLMDGRTLYRSLMNLVSNAIDACIFDDSLTKKHHVLVTTALEPHGFVRFEIQDNGSGMSPEVKDKLFTSFFSTKGAKGTGLGLLVTHKLIEEHQGTIDVTSQEGKGTTFIIRLPYRNVTAD
jgi:PAS domain S-box-containing protein